MHTEGGEMMRTRVDAVALFPVPALAAFLLVLNGCVALAQPTPGTPIAVTYADQGWSAADRDTFYTTSQGSRMMPYAWFKALGRLDNNEPFGGDQLQRYGYLPNARSRSNPEGLPVGFVIDTSASPPQLGMTCAACHTSQLEYQKDGATRALRLDGAPALVDFQLFLTDLTAAARATVAQADRFDAFAKRVLGPRSSAAATSRLKQDFTAWVKQFGDFMDASLPPSPWGPGRLDAFGMIFNRVAARDLNIPENFQKADAPVSYPFLWNASRQDRTQWNGGVPNGLFIQGLARNTGEVFGVFAHFAPKVAVPSRPPLIDYRGNSVKFAGLQTLEEKIFALKPPPWPRDLLPLDDARAARGKTLFEARCNSCHKEEKSTQVLDGWVTPVKPVGTDPKMARNAERTSRTGLLNGALKPRPPGATLSDQAATAEVLGTAVVGSLLGEALSLPLTPQKLKESGVWRAVRKDLRELFRGEVRDDLFDGPPTPQRLLDIRRLVHARLKDKIEERLDHLFENPEPSPAPAAYESRVLYGIWATAPYLHNGSVPSLWELLKPPRERITSFKVGSRVFDPKNVGWVTDASPFAGGTFTVDPANQNGNGNGGHDYGTDLSEEERWAIVEYMKTL
jgi:mono/diheme cytochrome c family protein